MQQLLQVLSCLLPPIVSPPFANPPTRLRSRFLTTPGPADKPLQCKILRTGGGLLKGGPQYSLLVEQEGGRSGAFLLAARKRKGGPSGSTYVLSVGWLGVRGGTACGGRAQQLRCPAAAHLPLFSYQGHPSFAGARKFYKCDWSHVTDQSRLQVDQHDVSRNSASYVGKLRSNFLGTEFVAYDSGAGGAGGGQGRPVARADLAGSPEFGGKWQRKRSAGHVMPRPPLPPSPPRPPLPGGENGTPRCELGAVMYQTNVLGTKGPRKMTVLLPKLAPGGAKPLALAPMGEGDTLLGQ